MKTSIWLAATVFQRNLAKQAEADLKFKYLGKIAADEQLDDYVLNGKSLLDLPKDNKAYLSVKNILKTLGYLIVHSFFYIIFLKPLHIYS